MAENTGIEWADHTFNPWIGCTKVSPACDHCYAEDWAKRFKGPAWGKERRRTSPANWKQPLKWNREATAFRAIHGRAPMVFCASLADVFDNQVPEEWRTDLWRLIESTPDLIWLLLTKRPQNIAKMLPDPWGEFCYGSKFWPNVWFGTTVENQAEADRRIPHLLSVPAAKRFLSCEPLLGPVDLRRIPFDKIDPVEECGIEECCGGQVYHSALDAGTAFCDGPAGPEPVCSPSIDWVIAGGESGREARPSHPDWFRSLRDQCAAAGVPFLFKQWGEWREVDGPQTTFENRIVGSGASWITRDGELVDGLSNRFSIFRDYRVKRLGKNASGRTLDGVIHDGRPVA